MSRLINSLGRIYTKLEMDNPSGSHKYRAATAIIDAALRSGKIIPGKTTIIEKSGGNFGLGLLAACQKYKVSVELAVGLGFSRAKREFLECSGARLIGKDLLKEGASPKEVISYYLENQECRGKSYYYPDQFNNKLAVDAHRYETAAELATQLLIAGAGKNIVFIGCAGTGASFTGVAQGLKERGFNVSTVLVEPSGSNSREGHFPCHRFEGMAVGVSPPFLDWGLVYKVMSIDQKSMLMAQRFFYQETGFFIGNTAAACFAAAKIIDVQEGGQAALVTIAYDAGFWYPDLLNAGKESLKAEV